jgi:predicted negative regulator of RcsB-dependent stress response
MQDWSDRFISFLQKGMVPLLVVAGLLVGGSVGYQLWNRNRNQKIEKANDELFLIQKDMSLKMQALVPPEAPANSKTKPAPKAKPTTEQLKTTFAPSVEKLQTFIKANEGLQPAVEAALLVSEITSEYLQYDEGVQALQTAIKDFDRKNFLYGVAGSELGGLLAKADKCNEATQVWEKVIAVPEQAYLADQLRLKAGVCYQKLHMYDKAEQLYNQVVKNGAESSNGRMAKKFLLYIKYVKSKAGNEKTSDQTNG